MHYVITNPTPGTKLGIQPGGMRDVSHEEMAEIVVGVARMLGGSVTQRLVPDVDASGQAVSKAVMGPAPNAMRIHCYAVDEGEKTELDAKSLLEIYAEDIKKHKAERAKRAAERRPAGR